MKIQINTDNNIAGREELAEQAKGIGEHQRHRFLQPSCLVTGGWTNKFKPMRNLFIGHPLLRCFVSK